MLHLSQQKTFFLCRNNNRPQLPFCLRGRQKFVMLVFAATRLHRVAFPASPKPPAGLDCSIWI